MKIKIPSKSVNPHMLMTKAGYHAHPNGQSYVMRLGSNNYPRFHVYFKEDNMGSLILNLHLDQTPAVNKWMKHAHRGEHDSDVAIDEAERLKRWIRHFII